MKGPSITLSDEKWSKPMPKLVTHFLHLARLSDHFWLTGVAAGKAMHVGLLVPLKAILS